MRVLNIMLGRGRGGIEQSFVDYAAALAMAGHELCNVVRPKAWAAGPICEVWSEPVELPHLGAWDRVAAWRLRQLAIRTGAQAAICHANRAVAIARRALIGICPVIGVAHNYSIDHFPGLDGAFAITHDIAQQLAQRGVPESRIHHVPNLVRVPPLSSRAERGGLPVIGSMGRFVKKKGFDVLLHALASARQQGCEFRAILGGSGEEEAALQSLCNTLGLADRVTFTGWVEDKEAFFGGIDVFVLPSLHEPFGIVLIEAMARGLPCISTDSEGPREILTHQHDGLLVAKNDTGALAAAIQRTAGDNALKHTLGLHAHRTASERYDLPVVARVMDEALSQIIRLYSSQHALSETA